MLTREQILNAPDLKVEIINVPEWGGEVGVKTITAAQKSELEESITKIKKGKKGQTEVDVETKMLKVRTVILTLCDADKKCFFTMNDIDLVNQKSSSAIERVFDVANKLNNILGDQNEEAIKN